MINENGLCPMCGTTGKEFTVETKKARNCPSCGTVFNEFGVIFAAEERNNEMEFN